MGCLANWYRAGLDVEREIPKLATYLGHVNDTYWWKQGEAIVTEPFSAGTP